MTLHPLDGTPLGACIVALVGALILIILGTITGYAFKISLKTKPSVFLQGALAFCAIFLIQGTIPAQSHLVALHNHALAEQIRNAASTLQIAAVLIVLPAWLVHMRAWDTETRKWPAIY